MGGLPRGKQRLYLGYLSTNLLSHVGKRENAGYHAKGRISSTGNPLLAAENEPQRQQHEDRGP